VLWNDMIFFCSCGSKRYREDLFICYHPNHCPEVSTGISNEQEVPRSQVPNMEKTQTHTTPPDKLLPAISRKLQNIQIRDGESTDPVILIALITLLSNKNKEEIKSVLRSLQDVSLIENTRYLINLYLRRNT